MVDKRLKAYAVLAGGGVKTIALAGALTAARELDFDFVGYGGTSAGAVIALLAAAGSSNADFINTMSTAETFTQFLEDGGTELEIILQGLADIRKSRSGAGQAIKAIRFYLRHFLLINRIVRDNGIYSGEKAQNVLTHLITQINPELSGQNPISFASLRNLSRYDDPPLFKVVTTDVRRQRAVIFPNPYATDEASALAAPVIPAVLASMCYPFLFWPQTHDSMVLVDGGVSSNLPIFLFRDEHQKTGYPIIAFDLVDKRDWEIRGLFDRESRVIKYPFFDFGLRTLSTALGATDQTSRRDIDGVRYVRVPVSSQLTLKAIPPEEQKDLFGLGYEIAKDRLKDIYASQMMAYQRQGRSRRYVKYLLQAFIDRIVDKTPLRGCRAYIMLPTTRGTRRVEYQFKMDGHVDEHMEIGLEKGATGAAWKDRALSVLDLNWIRTRTLSDEDKDFYVTLPPDSQQTIITVPLYDFRHDVSQSEKVVIDLSQLPLLGTLSIDTTVAPQTVVDNLDEVSALALRWARIISTYLR